METIQNREEQKHLLENAVEVVYDADRFAPVAALCETAVMSRSRHEAMVDSSLVELMKGDASERERRVLRRHGCIPRRV